MTITQLFQIKKGIITEMLQNVKNIFTNISEYVIINYELRKKLFDDDLVGVI